jgi:hypothetical protein
VLLEAADPVLALVCRLHVRTPRHHHVPTQRLPLEGIPFGLPVAQVARLEVQIEDMSVLAHRLHDFRVSGPAETQTNSQRKQTRYVWRTHGV